MRLTLTDDDGTPISSVKIGPARLIETLHDHQEAMLLLRELHERIPGGNPLTVPKASEGRTGYYCAAIGCGELISWQPGGWRHVRTGLVMCDLVQSGRNPTYAHPEPEED